VLPVAWQLPPLAHGFNAQGFNAGNRNETNEYYKYKFMME
jgi:hypothetical protein